MNKEQMAEQMAKRMFEKYAKGNETITINQDALKSVIWAVLDVFLGESTGNEKPEAL